MIHSRNIQKTPEHSWHVSFFMYICLLSRYRLSNCILKITRTYCALLSAVVERTFSCSNWDADNQQKWFRAIPFQSWAIFETRCRAQKF